MGNPLNLDALDGRLRVLLGLLNEGMPYGMIAEAVRRFADDYTSDQNGPCTLFRPDWETTWERAQLIPGSLCFEGVWIIQAADRLNDREREALIEICKAMLQFLKDSNRPRQRNKHTSDLREVLQDYLDLRGKTDAGEQTGGRLQNLLEKYPLLGRDLKGRICDIPRDSDWLPRNWESDIYPKGEKASQNIDAILQWLDFQIERYARMIASADAYPPDGGYEGAGDIDRGEPVRDAYRLIEQMREKKPWTSSPPPEPDREYKHLPDDLRAAVHELREVRSWVESAAQEADRVGVTLYDVAFAIDGDDELAKENVKRWLDSKKITAQAIGKDPLDRRRQLYGLSDILSDVRKILSLDAREVSKYRQALTSKLRAPAEQQSSPKF